MGKNLISQRRGRGTSPFRVPSFRYPGQAKHRQPGEAQLNGEIKDLIRSQGMSAPLAEVRFQDGESNLMIAPEGVKVGDEVVTGASAPVQVGNTLPLKSLPEGTLVHNIESRPGDGGKFVRSSGTAARIVAKLNDAIIVALPSKKERVFHPNCLATVGIVAGGGRPEKPFLKAGTKFHAMKKKNTYWPRVSGVKMNARDHPFGGSRSLRKGRPTVAPRNAPPGRKVGMIRARRTGRKPGGSSDG